MSDELQIILDSKLSEMLTVNEWLESMKTNLAFLFLFVYFYVLKNVTIFLFDTMNLLEAVQNRSPETEER